MRGAHLPILVLFAATCSNDPVNHLADAPPDSPPDGPSIGLVTLTVTVAGAPNPHVRVYFQNADSSLVTATETDAQGVASVVMETGGFVTAIQPDVAPPVGFGIATQHIATFAGVKPGDFLVLDTPSPPVLPFTLTVPLDAGAATYFLWTNCGSQSLGGSGSGSGTSPVSVALAGCDDAAIDMLVESRDGTGAPLHGLFQTVAITPNEAVTLTNNYAAMQSTSLAYTNVPAGSPTVDVDQVLATIHGRLDDQVASATVTGTTGSAALLQHHVIDATAITTSSPATPTGVFGTHHVVDWAPYSTSYNLDFGSILLGTYTGQPTFDVASHTIGWVEAPGLVADFALSGVSGFRSTPIAQSWQWRIASPTHSGSGVGSFTINYPVLPAPDDIYNFLTTDGPSLTDMVTAKVPGGYDSVRAKLLASPNGLFDFVTGANGQFVFQSLRGN